MHANPPPRKGSTAHRNPGGALPCAEPGSRAEAPEGPAHPQPLTTRLALSLLELPRPSRGLQCQSSACSEHAVRGPRPFLEESTGQSPSERRAPLSAGCVCSLLHVQVLASSEGSSHVTDAQ